MRKKVLPIAILSSIFALSTLTGCSKDEIASVKKDLETQIQEIQDQISELQNQIDNLKEEMNTSINETKEEFNKQIEALAKDIESLENELKELKAKHDQDKLALQQDYESKIAALDSEFNKQVAALQNSINQNSQAIVDLATKLASDKAELEADYNNKIQELAQLDQEARDALNTQLTNQINTLTETFNAALATLQSAIATNNEAITALTNKHNQDKAALEEDYKARIAALAESEQAARVALEEELNQNLNELDEKYAEEVEALQNDINANAEDIEKLTAKLESDKLELQADYNQKIKSLGESEQAAREALEELFKKEMKALDEKYEKELADLQDKIEKNTAEIANLSSKHAQDIENVINDYSRLIKEQEEFDAAARQKLEEELSVRINTLNKNFAAEVASLRTAIVENTQAINDLTSKHNADKAAIEADYNKKIKDLDDKYLEEVTNIYSQISALQTSITNLTNEMNAQIANIQADYQSQINSLTGRVSTLENVPTHTVKFEVDGLEIPDQLVKHGEKATRPELPEQAGYYYDSDWYIYNENETYAEPWYFYSASVTEDITLSMLRFPESYEVTLDENYPEGSTYVKPGLVYTGELFTCPVPSYAEHSFQGWYYGDVQITDSQGSSIVPYTFADNVTLVAHWELVHDGQSIETAYTVEEVLDVMADYTVGQWSETEVYVQGTFAVGTTYNTTHSSFSGFTVDHDALAEKQFQVYSAVLDSSIENEYGADGCLDGASFVVRGYLNLYQYSSGVKYEVAYDKNKSSPVILVLEGATKKEDVPVESITVDQALTIVAELDYNQSTPVKYCVYGWVNKIDDPWTSQYKNITFSIGDSPITTDRIQAFRYSCSEEFANQLYVGAEVKVIGNLHKYYNSDTLEIKQEIINITSVVIIPTE